MPALAALELSGEADIRAVAAGTLAQLCSDDHVIALVVTQRALQVCLPWLGALAAAFSGSADQPESDRGAGRLHV